MHISCKTKRLSSHCAKRGRERKGKIEEEDDKVKEG